MTGKNVPFCSFDPDDENPEWTEDDFARAVPHIGGKQVSMAEFKQSVQARMGRPKLETPKEAVNLRLDADVVAHFRSSGAGWQTRINNALRKAAGLPTTAPASVKAEVKRSR